MDLARYVVEAVVLEGRSYREVARAHGVSKSWVGKLLGRFREGGYGAIAPRSRAPRTVPHRTPAELEDEIVALRKELCDLGVDAGAQTIAYHLGLRRGQTPSISTIWRVLRRLGDGTEVEIVNFIDDHSRLAVASRVLRIATAPTVLQTFREAGTRWGFPAALLTDNGCVYTTWHRGGPNVMQTELLAMGIDYRHSRPYHPQTCGKVERFHQTMKAFLSKQDPAQEIAVLQAQVDRFVAYYNEVRPHRAVGRRPPIVAFEARDKARPSGPKIVVGAGVRVRRDRIDKHGRVTLRHRTKLHHLGIGAKHRGKRVTLLVHGLDVRVVSLDGELLRHLTLDPSRDYQPQGS
jgi:transposase InsO family protein